MIWGSIGVGYFIYGKKQGAFVPLAGGLVMIVVSYFVSSAMLMSIISMALMIGVYLLMKRGW